MEGSENMSEESYTFYLDDTVLGMEDAFEQTSNDEDEVIFINGNYEY